MNTIAYQKPALTLAGASIEHIATSLVCRNSLLREGISSILSGTRFVLTDDEVEDMQASPALILIAESNAPGELVATVRQLKAQHQSARVMVLVDQIEPNVVVQLGCEGLDGLCLTRMGRDVLLKALELVMLGEPFIPSELTLSLLGQAAYRQLADQSVSNILAPANDPIAPTRKFSEREAQILQLLTEGASNKHIARKLGLAEATIKVHMKAVMRKLNANNRTQAAMWAQQHLNGASDATMSLRK